MRAKRSKRKIGQNNKALVACLTALLCFGYSAINVHAADKIMPNEQAVNSAYSKIDHKVVHKVIIQGNQLSTAQEVLAAVPAVHEGSVLDVKKLSDEIMLANENSFRKISVDLRPAGTNMLDVYVTVQETKAVKFIAAAENTGNDFTGQWRTRLTYVNGNVGGSGQTEIVSFTTSPDHVNDVKQFGLYYNVPLPQAKDNVYITASYSDTNSGRIISDSAYSIDASGKGFSAGAHYVHNIARTPNSKRSVEFGLDVRQYKNDTLLTVGGTPVGIGVDVDTLPFSITYQESQMKANTFTAFSLGVVQNISSGGKNSTAQYELYRTGTAANYQIWRGSFNYQHMFASKWLTNVSLTGQYTHERLIYPEQLGLGGAHSLRGMNERDVSGDRGIQGNFELYTPEFAKGQRLLGFVDMGYYDNVHPLSSEYGHEAGVTCGIGWRSAFSKGYSAAVDFGYVLNGTVNTPLHSKKVHVSVAKVF
ncbi:MAG: hypothetical protein LLG02_03645 [Pelosinus sp.]|nr:hypothetical protein [Pelosinus sp.]